MTAAAIELETNTKSNLKEFHNITADNNIYFMTFRDIKYPEWGSNKKQKDLWLQYKSRVGN